MRWVYTVIIYYYDIVREAVPVINSKAHIILYIRHSGSIYDACNRIWFISRGLRLRPRLLRMSDFIWIKKKNKNWIQVSDVCINNYSRISYIGRWHTGETNWNKLHEKTKHNVLFHETYSEYICDFVSETPLWVAPFKCIRVYVTNEIKFLFHEKNFPHC